VKSVTEGIDANGEVFVRIEKDGQTFTGRGVDTDIIVAAAKAVLQAINRLLYVLNRDGGVARIRP
jgi:2-isopropylmalate synthase